MDNTSVPSSGLVPGHHQYDTIRALHPWSTPVFHHQGLYLWPSSVFRHQGIVPVDNISIPSSGLVPGHHQYNTIRALHPWTTPVFHHQGLYLWTSSVFRHRGLYLDITTITSAGHYTCMTSSVYHHQCILPMDNINNYSIVRAYQDLKNISSPSVYLDTISITSCGHCT